MQDFLQSSFINEYFLQNPELAHLGQLVRYTSLQSPSETSENKRKSHEMFDAIRPSNVLPFILQLKPGLQIVPFSLHYALYYHPQLKVYPLHSVNNFQ